MYTLRLIEDTNILKAANPRYPIPLETHTDDMILFGADLIGGV